MRSLSIRRSTPRPPRHPQCTAGCGPAATAGSWGPRPHHGLEWLPGVLGIVDVELAPLLSVGRRVGGSHIGDVAHLPVGHGLGGGVAERL